MDNDKGRRRGHARGPSCMPYGNPLHEAPAHHGLKWKTLIYTHSMGLMHFKYAFYVLYNFHIYVFHHPILHIYIPLKFMLSFYFILCDPKRTSIYTVHVIIYIISFHYATWCHQPRNDKRLNHDSATV
jgi:hypothetical protein